MKKTDSSQQKKRPGSASRLDRVVPWIGAFLAVLIAVAVKWTLDGIETQLRQQVGESLRTVVATTREGIELWVDAIEAQVAVLVHTPDLVSAVEGALRSPSLSPVTIAPIQRLQEVLNPAFSEYRYAGFAVIASDGGAVAGSDTRTVEASRPDAADITSALNGSTVIRLSTDREADAATSLVAAPVKDQTDRIIGALVLRLDATPGLAAITRLGRPGSTGETYIFDRDGRILTGSRFEKSEGIATAPTRPTIGGEPNPPRIRDRDRLLTMMRTSLYPDIGVDTKGYPDYRGIPVLGAWSWDDRLAIGIATEVDRDEALTPFRTIRMLTLSMLTVIGMSLLALLVLIVSRAHIRATNYALEQTGKARREVLGMVSHDLRSPLHHVLLSADLIGIETARDTVAAAAAAIQRSGRHMERLIADLLDVFEIGEGRLRIEKTPCDVASLLDDLRESFRDEAKERGIEIVVDCPADIGGVSADPERIMQILVNLAANAFKFTPRGGVVSVRAASFPDEMRFEVSDTGPGIPKDQLPRVFEQFFRATANSRQPGRGLGLYIARVLVEWHGGRIWAESLERRGAAFFFTIPREP
ncbi:MAG TPA: sensor histidine kinase [Gammaproteobacteria bacterium]|nr:sensor histidine kinase [Gammaproteobacteria bacterium]